MEEQDFNQLYENVIPHDAIADIREEWDKIIALPSQRHNALDSGSIAIRDRLYWSDSVDFAKLQVVTGGSTQVSRSVFAQRVVF